jgi:hypothetical protein
MRPVRLTKIPTNSVTWPKRQGAAVRAALARGARTYSGSVTTVTGS